MTEREALKMALEAFLTYLKLQPHSVQQICDRTITAIKEVLAQPEQEPVAECVDDGEGGIYYRTIKKHIGLLYTTPPQRTWVGLTDEEMDTEADKKEQGYGFIQGALWAEDKLKEKNT